VERRSSRRTSASGSGTLRSRLAGLDGEGYRFHDLRHTCVSRLVAAVADVKLVQAVAGHANPLITLKRYSHLLDSRVTEAAERFDPARVP
jgi:integrase